MPLKNKVVDIVSASDKPETPAPLDGAKSRSAGGRGKKKDEKPIDWGRLNRLLAEYVLIYGTDTVYDIKCRMVLKVNALRLAYGSDYVKLWLNSDQRRMILPDNGRGLLRKW